jgi:DNA modification methylase
VTAPYYEDDLVTLYHGDCREITAWLDADVLVTDPPYGVRWESRFGDARKGTRDQLRTKDVIASDLDTAARDDVLSMWGRRPAVAFGSWRIARPDGVRSLLVWHKEGAYSGPLNGAFFTNHEEVYVMGEGSWRKSAPPLRSVITTTEHRSRATRDTGHPTPKPIGLMELIIDRCPPGVIADPFAGSGSTLIAAKNLGRRVIGVELEERYCELAARALGQDTLFGGAA